MMRRLLFITIIFSGLFAQTYDSEIQPIWDANCTSCHGNSGNIDLSQGVSYSQLVNVASKGWPAFMRVKPGDSMNSVLHQKIVGNSSFGDRMPKGGTLSQADEQKIKTWIDNGAPQDWSGGASSSYSFDFGPGGWIDVQSPIKNESKWSIEFWMKFHQKPTSGENEIFRQADNNGGPLFTFYYNSGTEEFELDFTGSSGKTGIKSTANVFDQAFHHFYFEGDGSLLRLYIDGTEKASTAYTDNFPNSDNTLSIGTKLDGNLDEIRIRNISGFDGVPTQRYVAQTGVELLYQFDDQNTTTITDNSGKNNNGNIVGNANYEGDVYTGGGGGGMTEGIDVSYKSSDTFGGKVRIGYVPQGNDYNYWSNVTEKWEMGDQSFPGDYKAKVWNTNINDGEAHLIVFVDSDNNDQWDDATEYGAISQVFQVNNKKGNAGTLSLMKGGGGGTPNTIEIVVRLNQNNPVVGTDFGDIHVGVWYPGSNGGPDLVDNLDNQATPSPAQGWNFQLNGTGIIPSNGPYRVEAFFDQNNNDKHDMGEFIVNRNDIYTNSQGYAYTDIDLGGGGGAGSNLSVSLTVDGVADGINAQAIIDLRRSTDETLIQGFQFGETTPIIDMHKEFNVQGVSDGETVYLYGMFIDINNNSELLAEGQSNSFNWPPSGDINLILDKGTYTGTMKATITVNGTNESGSLSFRIFPEGTVITDEMPDLFGAIYGYDDSEVYSSPPTNQEIEINDLLNDVEYGIYPIVVWYDVGLNTGWDPGEDPFSPGQLTLSSGQNAQVSIGPLNILPGPKIQPGNLTGLTPNEDEDLTISVNVTSHSGPLAGEVEFVDLIYYIGSAIFTEFGCNSSIPGTYDCTVPGYDITNAGLAVEIVAVDEYGAVSSIGPYDVAVQFASINITSIPAERYIMISVPANLSNASINGVVEDELGEADPKVWRSFKWINGAYQENVGNLALGSAVWLISKEGVSINADNGYSTALLGGKTINLSNGWNQVGNPYNFQIEGKNLLVSSGVEEKLYQYSGGDNYTETTTMQPGSGYWIYSSGSGETIQINPMPDGFNFSSKQLASKATMGWKAIIEVAVGLQRDKVTAFGLHPEASNGYDQRDFHEPPVIGEYVTAYFEHPEAGSLNEDIRLEGEDLYTWPLSIQTNQRGIAEISIPDIYEIPSYLEVKLYDPVSRIVYNMRDEASIRITSQGSENPYYLELLVGSSRQIEDQLDAMGVVPSMFELAQNTPNPFNPVTNIRVSLIEDANITLKVYNLLGEEMNAMAINRAMSKGNHRFVWAGKDDHGNQLPSGVYLYRLEVISQNGAPLYQDTRKMVLMK
ncbi:hypothetical protein OAK09_01580 [Candidatus Marinimicrobia bacterium]|nr:hypothetical protein [Candidatus Neomarinimicrobiota bacterium]